LAHASSGHFLKGSEVGQVVGSPGRLLLCVWAENNFNRTGAAMLIFISIRADTIFSRRSTPDPFSSHAGSDFNAMETDKALGDDPSGVYF
jgi:hypothetical protein